MHIDGSQVHPLCCWKGLKNEHWSTIVSIPRKHGARGMKYPDQDASEAEVRFGQQGDPTQNLVIMQVSHIEQGV